MGKKIGILGGTFDPIHNGHLMMGKAALDEAALDELWFMPTGQPAYKSGSRKVSEGYHRARMTELAVKMLPNAVCSYIELERKGNTYTADTLTELCKHMPDTEFFYIVGADSLDYMDHWYHPEIIFAKASVLVVKRSTQSEDEVRKKAYALMEIFGGDICLLSHQELDVSSTQLREMAKEGKDLSGYMPDSVCQYILEHHLYQS